MSSLLRRPLGGMVALLVVLMGAALVGRFSIALTALGALLTFLLGWAYPSQMQRLSLIGIVAGQVMMAIAWLRPESNNYFVLAIGFAAVVVAASALHQRRLVTGWLLVWLMGLLLSAAYSTVVLNPSPLYMLLVVPIGALAVATWVSVADVPTQRFALRLLLAFSALQALLGVSQTVLGLPPFEALGGVVYSEPRNYLAVLFPWMSSQVRMATGTFEHFNGLGALLALMTPIAFGKWLNTRKRSALLRVGVLAAGVVSTFSRGALLGALLGVVLIYWLTHGESASLAARRALLVGVGILVILTLYGAIVEYAEATNNVSSRLAAWSVALDLTVADPARLLLGSGYGYLGSGYLSAHGVVARVHSAPIQILAELGIFGLGLFLLGVVRPLVRGLRSADSGRIVIAAGATAFLVHQLVDNGLFGFGGLLFYVVLAMLHMRDRARIESDVIGPVWE